MFGEGHSRQFEDTQKCQPRIIKYCKSFSGLIILHMRMITTAQDTLERYSQICSTKGPSDVGCLELSPWCRSASGSGFTSILRRDICFDKSCLGHLVFLGPIHSDLIDLYFKLCGTNMLHKKQIIHKIYNEMTAGGKRGSSNVNKKFWALEC